MARSLNRPVAARRTLTRTQQEFEQQARGPKHIVGDQNEFVDVVDGNAKTTKVRSKTSGQFVGALFDPTTGEHFT
jgi:hypothetical protein